MKKDKKQIQLDDIQAVDVADIQKEIIEAFAERSYKYDFEGNFDVFAVTMTIVISNMCVSLGIKKIDLFMNDLAMNIKQIHDKSRENCSYMYYEKGKKIKEGDFN